MKSTHLRKRIVAALLAVVLAVSLAAPSLAIEETGVSKSGSNGLTWEEIDSSSVQVESPIQANTSVVEKTVEHEDTDMVRVSIIRTPLPWKRALPLMRLQLLIAAPCNIGGNWRSSRTAWLPPSPSRH